MADDPTPDQSETFGEVEAFAELLRWSETQPTWQRDALRRIVENGDLGAEDIEALADFCLDPNLPGTVLAVEHVAAETAAVEPIALLGIERPTGINALAVDQELTFASTGLTIIYGDNGAGKSGYVRILKHACRTRDRGGAILHDLEDANRTRQTATIHFSRGAMADRWAWSPEAPGHADLSSVSIFDSRSANIHVEKTNAVAYIPQPMQVLEALAAACDRVKDALEQRGRRLAALTPLALRNATLKSDPAAGSFLASLSHRSNPAQLEVLSTLSDAEKQRQRDFETDLAQDPKVAAARITSERNRLERASPGFRSCCKRDLKLLSAREMPLRPIGMQKRKPRVSPHSSFLQRLRFRILGMQHGGLCGRPPGPTPIRRLTPHGDFRSALRRRALCPLPTTHGRRSTGAARYV